MKHSSSRGRRALGAAATLCIAVGAILGMATTADAAKPGATATPTVTATATVTEDTARVDVTVARAVKQIRTATCTLDGAGVACGSPSASGKKAATYTISLAELAAGDHQFAIALILTDGRRASASVAFAVVRPPDTPQSACASIGGTYVPRFSGWQCHKHFATGEEMHAAAWEFVGALNPVCESVHVRGWYSNLASDGGRDAWNTCEYLASQAIVRACYLANADDGYVRLEPDKIWCRVPTLEDLTDKFVPACTQLGGVLARETYPDEKYSVYTCAPA